MRFTQRFLAVFAVLLLAVVSVSAQSVTGTLTGTVTNDGAPLPGATVTVSSPAMQGVRTAVTDVNGNYNFGALPPGDYTVKVELSGMQAVTKTAHVGLSQAARADADLKISGVTQTITVTAASPVTAALESTEVQTNIQQKTVNELPIRRDIVNVGNLAPGVTGNTPSGGQLAISGAPASESLFLVNGATVQDNIRQSARPLYIEDAIQETTIQTGGISAEFGRFTGGVVSAITKSGGNEFSGSLRDNLENDAWTAMSDYAAQPPRLDDLRETYEATLGGRIIRDRLWFFLAGRYFDTSRQQFLNSVEAGEATPSFSFGQKQKRYEGKLTGQITPKHSLQGSYLSNNTNETNICFVACYNIENVDTARSLPESFASAHYNGILTSNWLLEANYSQKKFTFEGSGGDDPSQVGGTWAYVIGAGAFYGAPVFCGFCDPEERNNKDIQLKSTYYLATKALGTHNLVAGIDDFAEKRLANNFQSASNFEIYTFNSPGRDANGNVLAFIDPASDYIQYTPILELSKGSHIGTQSVFLNDKWDFNSHLNFNLGVRYDKNNVKDSSGNKTADDSKVSPRLGVTFDPAGNGRLRLNANYSTYVSHVQESIGGSGASLGGNPAYLDWYYQGPAIEGVPWEQAFQTVFNWFNSVGGINNRDLLFSSSFPGVTTLIDGKLTSPSADEWTLGAGLQVGANGYLRADYVDRKFHDFYGLFSAGHTVTDPNGFEGDLNLIRNSDHLRRDYNAAILQANYRFTDRFNLGGNVTWSETKGNFIGETSGSGPVTDTSTQYPELKAFPQNQPYGFIENVDETWKGRLFATYDLPTPVGSFTFGLLERYDSGTPYSLVGNIPTPYNYVDPNSVSQYVGGPSSGVVTYYFSDRGAFRWDDITATDVSVTYGLPISKVNLFVKGDLINAFNEQAQINGETRLRTSGSSVKACHDAAGTAIRCKAFNPFTDTPVEGTNWAKRAGFGEARSNLDYQNPRTVRVSFGLRF